MIPPGRGPGSKIQIGPKKGRMTNDDRVPEHHGKPGGGGI